MSTKKQQSGVKEEIKSLFKTSTNNDFINRYALTMPIQVYRTQKMIQENQENEKKKKKKKLNVQQNLQTILDAFEIYYVKSDMFKQKLENSVGTCIQGDTDFKTLLLKNCLGKMKKEFYRYN